MDITKILLILRDNTESGYEQFGNSGKVLMTYFDEEAAAVQLKELIEAEVKAERERILNIVLNASKSVRSTEHGASDVYLDMLDDLVKEEVNK